MADPLTPERRAELRRLEAVARSDDATRPDVDRYRVAAGNALPALLDAADEADRLRAANAELAAALEGVLRVFDARIHPGLYDGLAAAARRAALTALAKHKETSK